MPTGCHFHLYIYVTNNRKSVVDVTNEIGVRLVGWVGCSVPTSSAPLLSVLPCRPTVFLGDSKCYAGGVHPPLIDRVNGKPVYK